MHKNGLFRLFSMALGVALLGVLAGCGGSSGNSDGGTALNNYLSRVSTSSGALATQRTGSPATGSGPTVTASTSGVNIPGGSKQFTVTSTASMAAVAFAILGVDGYFELTGISGTSITFVVTFGQNAPTSFTIQVAASNGSAYGAFQQVAITMTTVGTGDVQVNLSWDLDSDMDLHVVAPDGEIYYGNRTDAAGGMLDLDSNAACNLDHKRSENVTWPTGHAPHGSYTVRADEWSACNISTTTAVVTVNVHGQQPQVFTNLQFTSAQADFGSAGAGRTITTFTY